MARGWNMRACCEQDDAERDNVNSIKWMKKEKKKRRGGEVSSYTYVRERCRDGWSALSRWLSEHDSVNAILLFHVESRLSSHVEIWTMSLGSLARRGGKPEEKSVASLGGCRNARR